MEKYVPIMPTILFAFVAGLPSLAQSGGGQPRFGKLLDDVQQAMTRATLKMIRRRSCRRTSMGSRKPSKPGKGQAVDRSKMMALVNDMQQIVDSGVFADADRAKLDGEFKLMQSMQSR